MKNEQALARGRRLRGSTAARTVELVTSGEREDRRELRDLTVRDMLALRDLVTVRCRRAPSPRAHRPPRPRQPRDKTDRVEK
jgi:hypothetical protein